MLALLALGLAASAPAYAQAGPSLADRLPAPTGPYAVGRVEMYWVDSSRTEPFLPSSSARREIAVYAWYPAAGPVADPPAPYFPHVAAVAAALGDTGMASAFGSASRGIAAGVVRSHSIPDAPLRPGGRPFPVLLFSPGFDESCLTYSAQLEDLASHGYVVFGIDHPHDASVVWLPGSRVIRFAAERWDSARARPKGAVSYQVAQVPLRTEDIRFVLARVIRLNQADAEDRFRGALDPTRIGVFGHSLGGIAAASVCRWDARVRACLNEDADDDGRPFDGGPEALPIKQPFLFFATGHSIYVSARTLPPSEADLASMKLTRAQYDSITAMYQHNQDAALASLPGGSLRIDAEAPDFTHRSFIDLKVLQATDSAAVAGQQRYLAVIRQYTRAFFDGTLRGMPSPLLDRTGPVDSLVTVETFGRRVSK
jgi:predicted dienelactone hydrolase